MEMFAVRPPSPWYSLFILLALSLVCTLAVQLLTIVGWAIAGGDFGEFIHVSTSLSGSKGPASGFIYVLLLAGSIGTFLLPSVLLQAIERAHFQYLPASAHGRGVFFLLSFLFLFAFSPLLGVVSEWNRDMVLPESMSGIESWMREKEEQMAFLTRDLVMTAETGVFLMNVLVFAVVPAVCEEFFFRGSVQGIAKRMLKNSHAAIWATAIIFSAIHFQFYGFLPRMLLGAMFGYMMAWSGNIWVPVFAHFVNNASVTVVGFIFALQGKTYEDMMDSASDYTVGLYAASAVGSAVVGYYFYKNSKSENKEK